MPSSTSAMTPAAVNCLAIEPDSNIVWSETATRCSRLAKPYPLAIRTSVPFTTATATPGTRI